MSIVLEQYTNKLTRQGSSPRTLSVWASVASRYSRWLGVRGVPAEAVTLPVLEDYFDGQTDLAASTKQTHLRYLQAAYDWSVRRGALEPQAARAMTDIVLAEPPAKVPRTISNAELRAIRDGILYRRDWIFFHLLAFTGMRRSEIRGLVWDDGRDNGSVLKLAEQTIIVFGKGRKGRQKIRTVPLHPAVGEVVAEERGEPGTFVVPSDGKSGVALETIQDMSRRLHPTYTPHDYRRTVATSLDLNGVPESTINRIMGWGASSIFQRYYRGVADQELHRAILRLYTDDPV